MMEDAAGRRLFAKPKPAPEAPPSADRRRFPRVPAGLPGRFLDAEGYEHTCLTVDLAPGGIRLKSSWAPPQGSMVVAYIHRLGRIEGAVARALPDGFAMQLAGAPLKTKRLMERISAILRAEAAAPNDRRRQERSEADAALSVILSYQGHERIVELLDFTEAGAAFRTETPLRVGDRVMMGARVAVVVQASPGGVVVNFL